MPRTGNPDDRKAATNALILSVVGCVCGGLLTNALTSSPTARTVGAVLGAAVPPLIANKGPGHRLRATAALGVTTLALFVAYGGFALVATASDTRPLVPLPARLDPKATDTGHTASGPAVQVSSHAVDCGSHVAGEPDGPFPCHDAVTVTSTGDRPLKVWSVVWDPGGRFTHNQDCVGKSLVKGDSCNVWVSLKSSGEPGPVSAQMTIHENVKTDNGIHVAVTGELTVPDPVGDLVISPGSIVCASSASELQITLTVDVDNPTSAPQPTEVTVAAQDVTETSAEKLPDARATFTVGQPGTISIQLPGNGGPTAEVALTVDPDGEIPEPEIDRQNDTVTIKSELPDDSQPHESLTCS